MLKFVAVLGFLSITSAIPLDLVVKGTPPAGEHLVPMLDGRIVGGTEVNITSYPWQLSLQRSNSHICGASIISSTWALTAAHCIEGSSLNALQLRAGSSYHASGGTLHNLSAGFYHGNFSYLTIDYDIAVLQPSSPFALGTPGISAISLVTADPPSGTILHVSGWGVLYCGGSSLPSQLRAVDVAAFSRAECRAAYGEGAISDRMLCAGYSTGGKDACQFDSGGPLVEGSVQVGIVSWGYGCASARYPGVYASVAGLRDWITLATGL